MTIRPPVIPMNTARRNEFRRAANDAAWNRAPRWLALLLCCVVWFDVASALAEPPLTTRGAGAPALLSEPSHAWLALPSKDEWIIVHVPPRRQARPPDGRSRGAADGTLRRAASISVEPAAMAAFGEEVFIAADDYDAKGRPSRRVWSLRAVDTGVGDLWAYEPADGLRSLRSLPSGGRLIGLAASSAGLVAVLTGDAPRLRVLWLDRGEWHDLATPKDAENWASRLRCVALRDGFQLIAPDDSGSARAWAATLHAVNGQPPTIAWADGVLARDRSLPTGVAPVEFVSAGQRLFSIAPAGAGRRALAAVDSAGSMPLAVLEGLEPDAAVAPLDGQGRLVAAWTRGAGAPRRPGEPPMAGRTVEMIELSSSTGRALYAGPSRADGPVTPGDLGLLGLVLIVAMGVALVLVVRGGDDSEISLPPGMALAEPGRRMIASIFDGALALVIASRIRGTPLLELASPTTFVTGELVWVLAIGIIVGAGLGTILEFLTGRSVGKAITACRVIRTSATGDAGVRPSLWQVLVRNMLKWALPPLTMLALVEPTRRSRVDLLTRTAVVVEFDPDADEPEPADDR